MFLDIVDSLFPSDDRSIQVEDKLNFDSYSLLTGIAYSFQTIFMQIRQPTAFPASNQCTLNIEENICNLRIYLTRLGDFFNCFACMFFKTMISLLNEQDEMQAILFNSNWLIICFKCHEQNKTVLGCCIVISNVPNNIQVFSTMFLCCIQDKRPVVRFHFGTGNFKCLISDFFVV